MTQAAQEQTGTENPAYMDKETLRPLGRTVDEAEVAKFAAMAEEWWDPNGKFKPLHKFNPVRIEYIRNHICAKFGRDPLDAKPLSGLRILDIGCGGGLLCEPMARMGADVTGIDATERSVHVAAAHAEIMELDITYTFTSVEDLADSGEQFDVVLNMEVVEHVADVDDFLNASARLVRPDGLMFVATLNRTAKAFALAIVGAEYVLGWLPRGTHDWKKFVKPSEIAGAIRPGGMTIQDMTGVAYNPLNDSWKLTPRDLSVNYMMMASKG